MLGQVDKQNVSKCDKADKATSFNELNKGRQSQLKCFRVSYVNNRSATKMAQGIIFLSSAQLNAVS